MKYFLLPFVFTFIKLIYCQNPYCELSCFNHGTNRTRMHTVCRRDQEKCGPAPACGSNFEAVRLTDKQRQMILDHHNAIRCRITVGNETTGNQPPAKNMRVLSYDRELEFISHCWANSCSTCSTEGKSHDKCRRTKEFENVGQNVGSYKSKRPIFNINYHINRRISSWYYQVESFKNEWVPQYVDAKKKTPKVKVNRYTQLVWADTYRVGCAASRFQVEGEKKKYRFLFVCNYAPCGNKVGASVYMPGESGSACPENLNSNNQCKMCGSFEKVAASANFKPYFDL